MLGHRLRRWPSIESTFWSSSRIAFAGFGLLRCRMHTQQTQDVESMLDQRWFTVYDAEPTLSQHWFNVLCLLDTTYTCLCHVSQQPSLLIPVNHGDPGDLGWGVHGSQQSRIWSMLFFTVGIVRTSSFPFRGSPWEGRGRQLSVSVGHATTPPGRSSTISQGVMQNPISQQVFY